ncbi:ABC transporter ATP-binding protein [Clostridium sediminicola]|uniref:ABC transporter ATP-binding protein n=1 Tax=Clostridium sediminicola TaxID=3114879 RepID=UPI0031F22D2C
MTEKILELKDVKTSFYTHLGEVQAVRGVSFDVTKGETVGVVGESGSGKSVTAKSIMRLIDHPGKVKDGEIIFKGENILDKNNGELTAIRGNEIAMIFQDPMTSLNPVYKIGNQIMEVVMKHRKLSKKEAKEEAIEMLRLVGIPSPESRIDNYPHEFSGGMRQRAMIAIALSCQPDLLIADEPTTALDVTIQAQILDLMNSLRKKLGTSIILITHDLGVVAETCSKVVVMYGGLVMEEGSASQIFKNPRNPYTIGLMKSIPKITKGEKERLIPIEGSPPDLLKPPTGCPFCERCPYAMNICLEEKPPYFQVEEGHRSMCWLLHEDAPDMDTVVKGGQ